MTTPEGIIVISAIVGIVGILIGGVFGSITERIWNPRECQCCYCKSKRMRKKIRDKGL